MRTYIATFFSHFGAMRFHKMLKQKGISGRIRPVPRDLSSSCGTCVEFQVAGETNTVFGETTGFIETDAEKEQKRNEWITGEMEQIVEKVEAGYQKVYEAENI